MKPAANAASDITIRPCAAPLGAEILGVDLSRDIDEAIFQQIEDAYNTYSVIVFREQKLLDEQFVNFAQRFGELDIHIYEQYQVPGHPEIMIISNIKENGRYIGLADAARVSVWHTDTSYLKEPSRGSLLYALEVPHDDNGQTLGDTLFASGFAAYDAFDEQMKKRLQGLRAIHRWAGYEQPKEKTDATVELNVKQQQATPDMTHPLIRTHPVTGRKAIYMSDLCVAGIVDLPDDEGRALLSDLSKHCTRAEFVYRHRWREGDLLMWDNTCTQHFAIIDYQLPQRRRMHRITLKGSMPF
ncbi:MAG: TauD/TfdA family dioxygenase [Acidiferrobacterales bacterium]|nr:TauD/TfdA family dioxygenase [Acidiferrobacterales bacterium]